VNLDIVKHPGSSNRQFMNHSLWICTTIVPSRKSRMPYCPCFATADAFQAYQTSTRTGAGISNQYYDENCQILSWEVLKIVQPDSHGRHLVP
jgi:hypothetical protein